MLQFVIAALAALLLSSPNDDCPHQVVVHVDQRITRGQDLGCGGLKADVGGVRLDNSARCPSFILIEPAHATTGHVPGSKTFTRPAGAVDVTLLTYSCEKSYFLVFAIGSRCQLMRQSVISRIPTYAQHPCEDLGRVDA